MDTQAPIKKALLIAVQLPKVSDADLQGSLAELGRLVHTLGYEVVGSLSQKRSSTGTALVMGQGKLKEIAKWTGGPGEVQSSVIRKKSKAAERFGAVDEDADDEDEEDEFAEEATEPEELEGSEDAPPEGVRGHCPRTVPDILAVHPASNRLRPSSPVHSIR